MNYNGYNALKYQINAINSMLVYNYFVKDKFYNYKNS